MRPTTANMVTVRNAHLNPSVRCETPNWKAPVFVPEATPASASPTPLRAAMDPTTVLAPSPGPKARSPGSKQVT